MNCEEVQAQLSDYLDKALPAADFHAVEAHLSVCTLCRTETHYLSECIRHVASLPVVEPPLGFTQRVMARVHEIDEQPNFFWQRWFFPLRIKIPLQATAVALVGILAIYILLKEPEKSPPISTTQNQVASTGKKQEGQAVKTDSQRTLEKAPTPTSTQPGLKTGQAKTTSGNDKVSLRRAQTLAEERPPSAEENGRRTRITDTVPVSSGPGPDFVPSKSSSSEPIIFEPFADYEMVFRLQNQARRENTAMGDATGQQTAGEDLSRLMQVVARSGQSKTAWFTVSKNQYEQWKKELRTMGTVESETLVPLFGSEPGEQNNGQLQIKLTVLPPAETKRAAPSVIPLSTGDK